MMEPLYVASHNEHKVLEFRDMLKNLPFAVLSLPVNLGESPEAAHSFEANAMEKAVYYGQKVDGWVLADDSGLAVDALDGLPGVHSARYAGRHGDDEANNQKLLRELQGIPELQRTAQFVSSLVLWNHSLGKGIAVRGTVSGLILSEPRGMGGFGYDPLFLVPTLNQTFAELSAEKKNKYSHRARAVSSLIEAFGGINI
jgi:XTP/dITP diphosphohydrolase